jgi:retron-type reverse transcriptase
MKFDTHIENEMPNTKILKPEVLAQNKMAATARHLGKPTKRSNSAIFEPILMKFYTHIENDMPNTKISKPEVLA